MYATYTYYSDSYGGGLDEATATPLLERASDIVDTLTFNRIVKITFGNLTTYQQERVQKASLPDSRLLPRQCRFCGAGA